MNIADAARLAKLPAKTIRYYEDIGLVAPPRNANGYRAFRPADLHKLAFVGRGRSLGFSIADCRRLLELYEDANRSSGDVRELAQENLDAIDTKLVELANLRDTLAHLIDCCAGDDRPDCPILADRAGEVDGH